MKLKHLYLLAFILLINPGAFAQTITRSQVGLGGSSTDIVSNVFLEKGKLVIAGSSSSDSSKYKSHNSLGKEDFWITRYVLSNKMQKIKKELDVNVGSEYIDHLLKCLPMHDGSYLLAGTTRITSGVQRDRIRLIKIAYDGTVLWNDTLAGAYKVSEINFSTSAIRDVDTTTDGGFVLLTDSSTFHIVMKFNANMQKEWSAAIPVQRNDLYYSIFEAEDGSYFLGGTQTDDITSTTADPVLTRLDMYGAKLWTIPYPALGYWREGIFRAIQTAEKDILLYGVYSYDPHDQDANNTYTARFYKLDNSGSVLWNSDIYLEEYADDSHFTAYPVNNNSFLFGFSTKHNDYTGQWDYHFEKINTVHGNTEWLDSLTAPNADYLTNIEEISPGNYIIAGSSYSGEGGDKTVPNLGGLDIWIAAITDTTGNHIATTSSLSSSSIAETGIKIYPNPASDKIYITTNGTVSFSLLTANGKLVTTKTINHSSDINVSKISAGIYYLRNDSTGQTTKIIVQH